jgi:plasmid stability protein
LDTTGRFSTLAPALSWRREPMNLTIQLPDEDVPALKAKATAHGVSVEQYALQVLEQDLAPEWLRQSWTSAKVAGVDQLSNG